MEKNLYSTNYGIEAVLKEYNLSKFAKREIMLKCGFEIDLKSSINDFLI